MRVKQLMEVGKLKFEGWVEPKLNAHKTVIERAEKRNSVCRLIKLHYLVIGEFEADIVLAFSAALRYLFVITIILCFWTSLK